MRIRLIVSVLAVAFTVGTGVRTDRVFAQATPVAVPDVTIPPVVWRLIAIATPVGGTITPADPADYTIQFLDDGSVVVKADCNNGTGSYSTLNYSIQIPAVALTKAACGPESLDVAFADALSNAGAFAYARDTLVLSLVDGLGALVFEPSLTGTVWSWTGVEGGASLPAPEGPAPYTITFGEDRTVAVQSDCNNGNGAYEIEEDEIEIGPLSLTRAECPAGSLSVEFVQLLEDADSFSFTEGWLKIDLDDNRGTLVFAAQVAA